MNSESIIEIIKAFEEFTKAENKYDIHSFALWIVNQKSKKEMEISTDDTTELDRRINYLLGRYNRYSKYYVRKSLQDLPIKTVDEFWILNYVYIQANPSKSETYDATITELSLGTKIVKRLISLNLINEFDDQIDKRTKRLSITEYGKQIRNEVFKRLGEDSVYKLAIIDKEHKLNLLTTLEKLEEYHNDLYKNTK